MERRYLFLFLILGLGGCATAPIPDTGNPPASQTAKHFEIQQTRTLAVDYLLFLPAGYTTNSARHWPLIFFLHGSGERGTDVQDVASHGVPKIDQHSTNFPFIVVSPQCPDDKIWSQDLLLALLDDVENRYAVDRHRVYLTGMSMGGYATWTLGVAHPGRFAAIAPVCGGGDVLQPYLANGTNALALKTLPVWAFHGAKDPIVPVEESERMVMLMKGFGDHDLKFTIYPDAGHDCWTQTYQNPELYAWFLKHSR
jgi:predicted peptidase